jgi:tetratricopeptide (TPR) repeat protein
LTAVLLVMCIVLSMLCLAGAWHFLVVVPSRWREPLYEAFGILASDGHERVQLEKADGLLDEAMNAGPRGRDLAEARFAHAYVRAMLGTYQADQYWAAAGTVESLATQSGHDPAAAHLAVWLQHRLERHERAVELYRENKAKLAERPGARLAAASSHLHLAGAHWRRRETDEALYHFDRVRDLGVLTEEIPKAADNLHVLKGIQLFFDQRHTEAREAFEAARERAAEGGLSTVEAELGLFACDWEKCDPDELDGRLGELLGELVPGTDGEYRKQLGTAMTLLSVLVLLRRWAIRPQMSGPPDSEDRHELSERVNAMVDIDPELGDAFLIEGLFWYYFAASEGEREKGLAILERGMGLQSAKAITVPEVLHLVERERALGGQGDALSRFLRLVHEFLADPAVPAPHREELRSLRGQFARYADDLGDDLALPTRPESPEDLRQRIEAVRRRIELIIFPRLRDLPDDAPARVQLRERLEELDSVADGFATQAQALHQSEHKLVITTGEFLLPQEEWDDHAVTADLDPNGAETAAEPGP